MRVLICTMWIEFNLRHNVQFYSVDFSVDSQKRIKTEVWTRFDRCLFDDNENALVWTGPKALVIPLYKGPKACSG